MIGGLKCLSLHVCRILVRCHIYSIVMHSTLTSSSKWNSKVCVCDSLSWVSNLILYNLSYRFLSLETSKVQILVFLAVWCDYVCLQLIRLMLVVLYSAVCCKMILWGVAYMGYLLGRNFVSGLCRLNPIKTSRSPKNLIVKNNVSPTLNYAHCWVFQSLKLSADGRRTYTLGSVCFSCAGSIVDVAVRFCIQAGRQPITTRQRESLRLSAYCM